MLRCPPHMVMITHFEQFINPKTGENCIFYCEDPDCPLCGKPMKFRDTFRRHSKNSQSECTWYVLRRFECCGHTHRALPDFLFPFKHYEADVVQAAIDGNTDDIVADDSTIRRWQSQWRTQEAYLQLVLMALLAQVENSTLKLIGTWYDIITCIRKTHSRWLAFVIRMLTLGCVPLYTQFAFCHSP